MLRGRTVEAAGGVGAIAALPLRPHPQVAPISFQGPARSTRTGGGLNLRRVVSPAAATRTAPPRAAQRWSLRSQVPQCYLLLRPCRQYQSSGVLT
eukprot:3380397-Rhodomonas_salina.1